MWIDGVPTPIDLKTRHKGCWRARGSLKIPGDWVPRVSPTPVHIVQRREGREGVFEGLYLGALIKAPSRLARSDMLSTVIVARPNRTFAWSVCPEEIVGHKYKTARSLLAVTFSRNHQPSSFQMSTNFQKNFAIEGDRAWSPLCVLQALIFVRSC